MINPAALNGLTQLEPIAVVQPSAPALINPDILQSIDKKIYLLTSGMMPISAKVDQQGKELEQNHQLFAKQAPHIQSNSRNIAEIFEDKGDQSWRQQVQ